MAIATSVAITGAAMYLDARYHLSSDLRKVLWARKVEAARAKATQANNVSVYHFFANNAARIHQKEALWTRERSYTWQETLIRAHQYGRFYLSHGVKPGDLVAFYLQNSADFIFAWLGLWCIGAAPAMINYHLAGAALEHCLRISGAKLVLVDAGTELQARFNGILEIVTGDMDMCCVTLDKSALSEIDSLSADDPGAALRKQVVGTWPVVLFYTSGTTGLPKAVPFTHARAFDRAFSEVSTENDRWYNCMPLYHGTGGIVSMAQLLCGTTLCVGKRFSTSLFWDDIRDSRATWFTYVGETARFLLGAPPSPKDREHCCVGMYGNGLRPDVWRRFQERFGIQQVLEFFSSSEGVFGLSVLARGRFLEGTVGHHGATLRRLYHDVYVPVRVDAATSEIIRDPTSGFAIREPYNRGGEMLTAVEDTAAFAGYYNNAAATAKKFVRDVFKKGDLYYRSGDALRRDDDGRGDTYRFKGENVSTAEVGAVMGQFKDVVEANVYGVALPGHDGRAGCAAIFVEESKRAGFDFTGFLRHAQNHLPRYAVPVFIRMVKIMTPIHNNKQNKVPLREEGVDPERVLDGDVVYYAPIGAKSYVPFLREHWEGLGTGRVRL